MKKHLDIRRRHTNHPSACLAHWGAVSPQRNNTWCQTRRRGKSTESTGYRHGCTSKLALQMMEVLTKNAILPLLSTFLVYPFSSSLLMCCKKMENTLCTSHCHVSLPLERPTFRGFRLHPWCPNFIVAQPSGSDAPNFSINSSCQRKDGHTHLKDLMGDACQYCEIL